MRSLVWMGFALVCLGAAGACDKDEAKATVDASVAAPPSAKPLPPPELQPEPRAPAITVDDKGCTVDGTPFTGAPTEWQIPLGVLVAGKPHVVGEAVVINVLRDTKVPRVEAVVAALVAAKAKSVVVRTPTRDQTTGELELTLHPSGAAECSAVAMIEHDGAVALWSKGGGGAQRFARGMAGPDLTSSTEALKKRASACDSPIWFLGAGDAIPWGLAFDLAMRSKSVSDGGAALRPKETMLLTHAPTPGQRVKEE